MKLRIANDAYYTVDPLALHCTKRLLEHEKYGLPELVAPFILEPSCGGGSFIRACQATFLVADINALDIEAKSFDQSIAFYQLDFVNDDIEFAEAERPQLVIGNPPYSDAELFVVKSLYLARENGLVAFVLRKSFLGSKSRLIGEDSGNVSRSGPAGLGLFWVFPITPRPSFTGTGTDNSEYDFVVWKKGYRGWASIGEPIVWK